MDRAIGNVYDEQVESFAAGMVAVVDIVVGMGAAGKNVEGDMGPAADEMAVVEDAVHTRSHTHVQAAEDTPHMDSNVPEAVARIEVEVELGKGDTVAEKLAVDGKCEDAEDTLHRVELAGLAH